MLDFAKEWSYVIDIPISRMLEEYLERQQKLASSITPFQWLSDPYVNPSLPPEDEDFKNLDEYVNNREEEEFCRINPDHPRAKLRRTLVKEHKKYLDDKMEQQKNEEKELIKRWMEVFHPQNSKT
ncbi:MAG: hypothetical protein M8357_01340 [Desulfobulbaceae bacterium]|nr:hypothetical protein [Desulfobulbaceae bacterium]